ncbi:MAG: MBL fold metallo-hydrolase [Clostridia bacterium]|nr:MBL fold metallo-hydrolase [Clostridia bacterium]
MRFELLTDGIYRLKVPFENIFTSVFALVEDNKCILLDSGCNERDVNQIIIPALDAAGFVPQMMICSHLHSDHSGGMQALLKAFPKAKAGLFARNKYFDGETIHLSDGGLLSNRFRVLNLKGHTDDCLAVLDEKTSTLLSFDCLQLFGVGRYGTAFSDCAEYLKTLERVRDMRLEHIIASHEYVPCGSVANGQKEVNEYLDQCEKAVACVRNFAEEHADLGFDETARLYNAASPLLPPIGATLISSIIDNIY